jgi:Domain of unknown function (DUF4129)
MSQGSARRALSVGAALLALLAVVALASRGHVAGSGDGETRHIRADFILEYVFLIFGLAALVLVPVLAIGFHQAKDDPSILPKRGNWMGRVFLTGVVFAVAVVAFMIYRSHHGHSAPVVQPPPKGTAPEQRTPKVQETRPVGFDWVPVIVVFSIAGAGAAVGGVYYLRTRKRRPLEAQAAAALAEALDESLEDLRSEPDARRAVIAAYARMERALAASGLPRRAAEAPLEYMTRVLGDLLRASAASVSRLTALFERAKFSTHEIGAEMKEEAIEALVAVRDELRAYS